ncbi:MAG: tRNA (adenosine(37)-N6)-threonylcarbamoyltransferase complex ATPase subunit type 1 TsaE [Atopobiaceae bacterium]|nr:tRNA (adenosine(37)-N6)-threonylcarbamoyltransferase complex ATPase subunit type 1 TsaE [Atopobiaceae bacterium]
MFACGAGDKFVVGDECDVADGVLNERASVDCASGETRAAARGASAGCASGEIRPSDVGVAGGPGASGETRAADVARLVDGEARSAVVTRSTADTVALGERLGRLLEAGDVLVLTGDLGAGKTQLTKGIARGMGVEDDVCSPTFTIGMVYEGDDMPLYHFDLYRLEDAEQLDDTGIFDVLGDDGPCVIEWGEQFADELGDERLDVALCRLDDEAAVGEEPPREVSFVAHGERAAEIIAGLGL